MRRQKSAGRGVLRFQSNARARAFAIARSGTILRLLVHIVRSHVSVELAEIAMRRGRGQRRASVFTVQRSGTNAGESEWDQAEDALFTCGKQSSRRRPSTRVPVPRSRAQAAGGRHGVVWDPTRHFLKCGHPDCPRGAFCHTDGGGNRRWTSR